MNQSKLTLIENYKIGSSYENKRQITEYRRAASVSFDYIISIIIMTSTAIIIILLITASPLPSPVI